MDNEKIYRTALSEIDDILHFFFFFIKSKIPNSLMDFINKNKDPNYISKINPYVPLQEQDFMEETKNILALIYRSYVATDEEKQEFLRKDKQELEKIEEDKKLKYNPDNIFQNENLKKDVIEKENTEIAVIEEKNIFQKLFSKIKNILKKLSGK